MKALFWRLADPILLRMRSRLQHLEDALPADAHLRQWRAAALYPATVRIYPDARVENRGPASHVRIGDYSCLRGELVTMTPEATIRIGTHCFVGPGSRIWAQREVAIGDHVLISHLVDIHDSSSHASDAAARRQDGINLFERDRPVDWTPIPCAPVTIEDDAWIGFKSSILKGVTIGRGAIVAAGSMVTRDVPAFTVVAGNPARVVRTLAGHAGGGTQS